MHSITCVGDLLAMLGNGFGGRRSFIYRGVRCFDYSLVPSLFRMDLERHTDAHAPPGYHMPWAMLEGQIQSEFHKEAQPYVAEPLSPLRNLMLAQHYGAPTRLLDWTTNPSVALYFATECPDDGSDAALYSTACTGIDMPHSSVDLFNKLSDVESDHSPISILRPPPFDHRVVAQSGVFTFHRLPSGNEPFEPAEQLKLPAGGFTKVRIPAACKGKIKLELELLGIDRASLFPGMDGIGHNLRWVYEHRHKVLRAERVRRYGAAEAARFDPPA